VDLSHFKNLHRGEICLVVGNGANLGATHPASFPYPAIGMNTIHLLDGWTPDYYVGVDHRLYREFGEAIASRFRSIPKFVPAQKLDEWQGENFVRFNQAINDYINLDRLESGIYFSNVMHAALQLAYYMGFTTLLIVGMEHKPDAAKAHFWGWDDGIRNPAPLKQWFMVYRLLAEEMYLRGVKVLNISQDTYVPNEVIPRADWRDYESKTT
jgi:hypothetical protein